MVVSSAWMRRAVARGPAGAQAAVVPEALLLAAAAALRRRQKLRTSSPTARPGPARDPFGLRQLQGPPRQLFFGNCHIFVGSLTKFFIMPAAAVFLEQSPPLNGRARHG